MRFIVALAIFSSAYGCGRYEQEIAADLRPYLDHYLEVAPSRGRADQLTSMTFGELESGVNGVCNIDGSERTITIARRDNDLEPSLFAATIYHEIGHCLHDLRHTDGEFDIMNPHRNQAANFWRENIEDRLARIWADQ